MAEDDSIGRTLTRQLLRTRLLRPHITQLRPQTTQHTQSSSQVVALMAEDDSIGRTLTRQLLRTRRPFKTTVFSADGERPVACPRCTSSSLQYTLTLACSLLQTPLLPLIKLHDGAGCTAPTPKNTLTHTLHATHTFTGSEVLFKVSRPFYLISSSMTVLDSEDNPIGEIKQRWHPWKRSYDL